MNGNVLRKTTLGLSHRTWISVVLEGFLLILLGVLAITLHARMRTPLNIPGHHGIEFMAIFIILRMGSNLKFAGSVSSLGIGLLLLFPVLDFKDPFMGFNYMLPGIMLDFLYLSFPRWRKNLIFVCLIAGLAYFTIPLSRLILMTITGYPYQTFIKHGQILPVFSFLFFGIAGGLAGKGVVFTWNKYIKKS